MENNDSKPWKNYAAEIKDYDDDFNFITTACSLSDKLIEFLMQFYYVAGDPPEIEITLGKLRAYAQGNKIVLSRQIFDFAKTCSPASIKPSFQIDKLNGINFNSPDYYSLTSILWIVSHEFFHHARGHLKILTNHPHLTLAIEYDADCYATVGLFRFFERVVSTQDSSSIEIKKLVLNAFFWPFRLNVDMYNSGSESTHAPWYLRIFYCISKLLISTENQKEINFDAVLNKDKNNLIGASVLLEYAYLKVHGKDKKDSKYIRCMKTEFTRSGLNLKLQSILNLWIEAEPIVLSEQRLLNFTARNIANEIINKDGNSVIIFA